MENIMSDTNANWDRSNLETWAREEGLNEEQARFAAGVYLFAYNRQHEWAGCTSYARYHIKRLCRLCRGETTPEEFAEETRAERLSSQVPGTEVPEIKDWMYKHRTGNGHGRLYVIASPNHWRFQCFRRNPVDNHENMIIDVECFPNRLDTECFGKYHVEWEAWWDAAKSRHYEAISDAADCFNVKLPESFLNNIEETEEA